MTPSCEQQAADADHLRIHVEFGGDMPLGVIAVKNRHHRSVGLPRRTLHPLDDLRLQRASNQELDPWMRNVMELFDVNRNDAAMLEQIKKVRVVLADPPRFVPVSISKAGLISAIASWISQRSSTFCQIGSPNHVVFEKFPVWAMRSSKNHRCTRGRVRSRTNRVARCRRALDRSLTPARLAR